MADKQMQIVLSAKDEATSVFKTFQDNASSAGKTISDAFSPVTDKLNAIGAAASSALEPITQKVKEVAASIQAFVAPIVSSVKSFDDLKTVANNAFESIKTSASSAFASVTSGVSVSSLALSGVMLAAKAASESFPVISSAASLAFSAISSAIGIVSSAVSATFTAIPGIVTTAFDIIKTVASAGWAAITGGASLVYEAFVKIIDIAGTLVEGLRNLPLTIGSWAETAISPLNLFADTILNVEKAAQSFFKSSIFELAGRGGQLAESFSVASDMANAYGVSLSGVEGLIKNFGEGALQASERMTLASKAIQSGLGQDGIAGAMEFAEKRSKITGESFDSLASTIFKAFETGKFERIGKSMGLMITSADDAASVMQKMGEKSKTMGEGVFNSEEKIVALNTSISDFVTYIGKAVNSSGAYQRVIQALTKYIGEFVDGFDYASVGAFFDNLIHAGEFMYQALRETFGGVFDYIRGVFSGLGTAAGSTEFFKTLVSGAIAAAQGVLSAFQNIVNVIGPIFVAMFGKGITAFGEFISFVKSGAIDMGSAIAVNISKAINFVVQAVNSLAKDSAVARFLGLDSDAWFKSADAMINLGASAVASFKDLQEANKGASVLGSTIEDLGRKVTDYGSNLTTNFADRFAEITNNWQKNISKFELPPVELPKMADLQASKDAADAIEQQKSEAAQAKRDKLAAEELKKKKDAQKLIDDAEKDRIKGLQDKFDQEKKAMEDRVKAIDAIIKRNTLQSGETFKLIEPGVDLGALAAEKKKLEDGLKSINDAEASSSAKTAADLIKKAANSGKSVMDYLKSQGMTTDSQSKQALADLSAYNKNTQAEYDKMVSDSKNKMSGGVSDARLAQLRKNLEVGISLSPEEMALLNGSNKFDVNSQPNGSGKPLKVSVDGENILKALITEIITKIVQQARVDGLPLVLATG